MRSDYETFLARRADVLKDLQAVSRRANSVTPVVGYEDIGIIRNTIGPAMVHQKFGEAGTLYLSTSPSLFQFYKEAGWLGNLWGDVKSGISSIGSGLLTGAKGVGSALWGILPPVLAYRMGKGIYEGATGEGPWYSRVGRALSGAVEGAFRPVSDLGEAAYDVTRGAVKGVGQITQAEHIPGVANVAKTIDPYARMAFRDILPTVGMMMLPGGQAAGAARAAGTVTQMGRLARMGQAISRGGKAVGGALRMAEAPAATARSAGALARVGRGLKAFVAPTAGEMQAVGQTARGFGRAAGELAGAPSLARAGEAARAWGGTYAQTFRNLSMPAMGVTLAANLPTIIPAVQQHGWGALNPVQPEAGGGESIPSPVPQGIRGAARGLLAQAPTQPGAQQLPYGELQAPPPQQIGTGNPPPQQPDYTGYGMGAPGGQHVVV